jgi:hypothetical protein
MSGALFCVARIQIVLYGQNLATFYDNNADAMALNFASAALSPVIRKGAILYCGRKNAPYNERTIQ